MYDAGGIQAPPVDRVADQRIEPDGRQAVVCEAGMLGSRTLQIELDGGVALPHESVAAPVCREIKPFANLGYAEDRAEEPRLPSVGAAQPEVGSCPGSVAQRHVGALVQLRIGLPECSIEKAHQRDQ